VSTRNRSATKTVKGLIAPDDAHGIPPQRPSIPSLESATSFGWLRLAVVVLAIGAGLLSVAPAAFAAPDITLDKDAPGRVLFGEDSTVTLRAANPAGQPYGYNLSLRDVLPPGVSYVPGSVSAPVAPRVIDNAPNPGETTLIFENVSDLSPGSTYALSYDVRHDTVAYGIGDTYVNQAGAYINEDPRFVPDFAPDGTPTTDITGSDTDAASTQISAVEIEKHEPSPEGELLRGAHDHQTVYTLTVRNNGIAPTSGLVVEDWLPAGLEYLGCGTGDNTSDAPTNPSVSPEESPGSGPLNPGNAPPAPQCLTPDLVETAVIDPDGTGPLPTDVYTHVVWDGLGALSPDGELEIQYVAAVPIRENTTNWTSPIVPTPESLAQGSNLDNNSGDETTDEQALTNYAEVAGLYDGTLPVSDDHQLTRWAEDLRVLKDVNLGTINQGQISIWSLQIDTSEYRYVDDVRVTDTLPDGLCPLGGSNLEGGGDLDTECDPTGDMPSAAYTDVEETADGSWTISWDDTTVPELARRQPSSSFTITFPTKTRAHYQENFQNGAPVLAEDSWQNGVSIAGRDFRTCAPADPDCEGSGTPIDGTEVDGEDDLDTSSAGQQAGGITIDKKVREATPGMVDCATGAYVDGPPPSYGPGDHVCWQLRVDFASLLDTGEPTLTDFLPPGTSYVPGSAARTANDTLPSTTLDDTEAGNGVLTWELGGDVPEGDLVFEWRFATQVEQGLGDFEGDLEGNLMKLSFENTGGQTFPLRDEVNFERSQARVDLVKGVRRVNAGPVNGPNVDGATVAAGDMVEYRIDVTNDGDLMAWNAVVSDQLQDGITCADVLIVSHTGGCSAGQVTWTIGALGAGATEELNYVVRMPNWVEPGKRFDNTAEVVSYQSETNVGSPAEMFDYVPGVNAPEAEDDSFVQTRDLTFTKTRTTDVDEAGNNASSQATIGEGVNYTMTLVIPEGTTVYDGRFSDTPPARFGMVTDVDVTVNGAPPSGIGWSTSIHFLTGEFIVTFPTAYSNPPGSGDDTIVFTLSLPVADVPANRRTAPDHTITNEADFDWQDQNDTPFTRSASVDTTIVEPNLSVTKNEDDADDVVSPGQSLTYTLTATNTTGTRVSTAHDVELVDHVPAGLTPVVPSISDGGTWDSGARTITWTIDSLAPGASANRTYSVTVDDPATAGSTFPNTIDLTGTSMDGTVAGERTSTSPVTTGYVDDAADTVQLADATLTKDVAPGDATVGDDVTYTVNVTFPENITYYDATVIDTLSDGMDFDATLDVTCDAGGPCTPPVASLAAEPQPDGSTRLAWFLGDLPDQPDPRTYSITYSAHVDDTYVPEGTLVSDGQTLTNVAGAFYNGADSIVGVPGSIPDPAGFTDGSPPDDASVEVVEPLVGIDKRVSDDPDLDDTRPTQPGDSYTYSLIVSNTGTAPAYDVEVTDTPDAARLNDISVTDVPGVLETNSDGSDGSLGWRIPGPIAPGGSVTLTYTADLVPSAQLSDSATVVNTADVPVFWGVPLAERLANPLRDYRPYTSVPEDVVTLDVHLPQLAVTKTTGAPTFPDSAGAQVGETFPWRVVVSNTSTHAVAESVDVSDVLPPNWSYVAGSANLAPGGAVEPTTIAPAPTGDTLTWANVGDLLPGGQVVLTFDARPTVAAITNPGTGTGSPNVNTANASAVDVSGAPGSADGLYADGDGAQAVLEIPNLVVTKTPDSGSVRAGDPASYSIQIANTGPVPARDVVVSDVLGAGQTYTAGTATALPAPGFSETSVTPGGGQTTIVWEIDEIPASGSVTITLPVDTDPGLPNATVLPNEVSVTSREITTAESDSGSHLSTIESDVGIVKQAQAAPVDAGEEMDFTLTVTNHGPSDATGVTVEDTLRPNLAFVSAEAPCAGPGPTIECAIGNLGAGDSVELTLRVEIDPDETVGVDNTATVGSTTPDSNPANDSSTASKPVGVDSNVRVEKDGPAAPVLQGTSFDYVIRVVNDGVSTADAVTLNDALPAGVTFESVTTDLGTCIESSGTIDCDFGAMQPGDDAEVTVRVLAVDVGTPLNTAIASTPSDETTTADNEDTADVTILPTADLGVTKTAPATATPGTEIDYMLEIVNNGPSPATDVSVVDTLPAGLQFVSADAACSHAAGVVTCDAGDMAVSDSLSFTVRVAIPFALGGQSLTNTAVVAGNEGDLVAVNDSAQATTTVDPAADLTIAKTAGGATAGETASWTIVVQNDGPSTAAPVTVTDTLPAGTTFISAAPSQGNCSAAGANVTCDLGALAAGGSAQISLVASVAAGTAGQELRNRATVSAPQVDPDPSNNAAEAATRIVAPAPGGPDVILTKTASTDRPALGRPFRYRLEVRNAGDRAARGVRVIDTLTKAVLLRKVTTTRGRCSEDGSTVECSIRSLAPGSKAVVTLTVVATDPGRLRNTASARIRGGADIRPANNGDVAGVMVRAPEARLQVAKRAARRAVRGGETVGFKITVRTGKRAVADAWVCDRLPAGLVFVRARNATFRKGRACWQLGYMRPNAKRVVKVMTRAERGFAARRVRNVGVAGAMNARRRAGAARVQVAPAFGGAGGGVTG
jgi:large repetitive protein